MMGKQVHVGMDVVHGNGVNRVQLPVQGGEEGVGGGGGLVGDLKGLVKGKRCIFEGEGTDG